MNFLSEKMTEMKNPKDFLEKVVDDSGALAKKIASRYVNKGINSSIKYAETTAAFSLITQQLLKKANKDEAVLIEMIGTRLYAKAKRVKKWQKHDE